MSIIDVKKFGAVGDGKTDDTAAIGKALAECNKVGGTLMFPKGNYLCNGKVYKR